MYTSGTTGVPKGVLSTHRNLAAAAETSPYWNFDADSVSLTPLPMFHIGGIGWAFLGLWNGATTVLVSEFDAVDRPRRDRARAGHECRPCTDDAAIADCRPGRCRARLFRPSLDRLRRVSDHDARPEGRAADLQMLPVRDLRVDGEHRRRRAARSRGPRPRRPSRVSTPLGGATAAVGRATDRRPGDRRRAGIRRDRRGMAPRAERHGRVPPSARRDCGSDHAGRLVAHRRRWLRRRRGLPLPHRPDQGHDRQRR